MVVDEEVNHLNEEIATKSTDFNLIQKSQLSNSMDVQIVNSSKKSEDQTLFRKPASKKIKTTDNAITVNELNLTKKLLKGIKSAKINKLTVLQATILPTLMENRTNDFLIKSRLHSGKKTAFIIAALERIDPKFKQVQVIVLEPSRELVHHTLDLAQELAKYTKIKISTTNAQTEIKTILNSQLIISSLGSLIYYLKNSAVNLNKLNCFIFDELEILLGSTKNKQKLHPIIEYLSNLRTTFLYFSNSPNQDSINFVKRNQIFRKPKLTSLNLLNIEDVLGNFFQFYIDYKTNQIKIDSLIILIQNIVFDKIVLFVKNPSTVDFIDDLLKRNGFETVSLTSKSEINERLNALNYFNTPAKVPIIFIINYPLTHGILGSFSSISMVINFDLPYLHSLFVEYLHKICVCRTPNDKPAFVVNFVNLEDKIQKNDLKRLESFFNLKFIKLDLSDDLP